MKERTNSMANVSHKNNLLLHLQVFVHHQETKCRNYFVYSPHTVKVLFDLPCGLGSRTERGDSVSKDEHMLIIVCMGRLGMPPGLNNCF